MKALRYLTAAVLLLAFLVLAITNPVLSFGTDSPAPRADSLLLKKHVLKLASTVQPRMFESPPGLEEAAKYIHSQLDSLGCTAKDQVYKVGDTEFRNIIVSFGPENASRLIVGAHYDVCGDQPGADDNASGVAGLLELARMLKGNSTLNYRIDLVFYTLEEPPNFRTENMGSYVHAKSLHDQKTDVMGMVCLEMIGYFSDSPKSQHYPIGLLKLFYPNEADYIAVVSKFGQGRFLRKIKKNIRPACDVDVRSINAPAFVTGIDFSDHLNYWKFGYDAVMITDTSFYRNANYHQKTDTPGTLNYSKMAEVVRGVYNAIITL